MQIDRPITIALLIFIIILLVFFLVVPEYNTFKSLQTQLSEKTAEYNAQYDYYVAIDKTYQSLQSHQNDIQKIDDALPQGIVLGQVIFSLQEIAKDNGLMVKDLFLSQSSSSTTGSDATSNSNIKEVVFSTDLLGSYASLESFLTALEKSSRIFEVTSISFGSIAAQNSKTDPSLQNFSLQIKTYSY